jgi:large subunit ribosomal protein L18
MDVAKQRIEARGRIRKRIRRKVTGTAERPRLAVRKSLKHIYVQVIDDSTGRTLLQASTRDKDFGARGGANVAAARAVGELIAKKIRSQGLTQVVFDRGGYLYHGSIKALADAARASGLEF